jgi:hypothetical protein
MKTETEYDVPGIGKVSVVAQTGEGITNGVPEFWDLFDEQGSCLNEGCPLWQRPSQKTVLDFFKS